jgi:serine/threonine protein kinase
MSPPSDDARSPLDALSTDRIAHYRLVRELGRGGQATVYLAADVRDDRRVALKVLDRSGADHGTFERFRREADIASKLDHPGICAVYEAGEDRGSRWIAMRYVEGETLAARLACARSGSLSQDTDFLELSQQSSPEPDSGTTAPAERHSGPCTLAEIDRTLALFENAARALHVAHEAGIIHRDIKPANIMVTAAGDPVILDFGLAQEIDGNQPTLTLTGDVMGTPAYMSPEQIAAPCSRRISRSFSRRRSRRTATADTRRRSTSPRTCSACGCTSRSSRSRPDCRCA